MKKVQLKESIKRESGDAIKDLCLRKIVTGDLRGLKLLDILQIDVNTMRTLLVRIAQPTLTDEEFNQLTPGDLTKISEVVATFFTD